MVEPAFILFISVLEFIREIRSGYLRAIGAFLATSTIALIAMCIPPLRRWVSSWFGSHSTSAKTDLTIFLSVLATVLLVWSISWLYRKGRAGERREIALPVYGTSPQQDDPLTPQAFEVLKLFDRAYDNPNANINVQIVARQCGISEAEALACVQSLWHRGFIRTTIVMPGEWKSLYRITQPGLEHVRRHAH